MNGFKPANARARLSILAHNTIIVGSEGSFAKNTDDIDGLGLEDEGTRADGGGDEENIEGFISQISREGRSVNVNGQVPWMMNPFPSYEDLNFYDPSRIFAGAASTQLSNAEQSGQIEDWISELLQAEG